MYLPSLVAFPGVLAAALGHRSTESRVVNGSLHDNYFPTRRLEFTILAAPIEVPPVAARICCKRPETGTGHTVSDPDTSNSWTV